MIKPNNTNSIANSDDPEPDSPVSRLTIDISVNDTRWQPLVEGLRAHASFVWERLGLPDCELSLVLDSDSAVQLLNRDYRDKDKPTNVLSFPAFDFAQPATADDFPPPPVLLGDIVMAYETLDREASAGGRRLADHSLHLLTHGLLHLIGHDHEGELEATRMEHLEVELLGQCGIADPYQTNTQGDVS
ncbi:rRNA maturation RNase YbeY [Alphaproteobacteria bacterium]|nr:rRNA maturation RNase YbeY [Alphaproteobacteria bacterium]MDB2668298.1 rRNA maturation RNase YbeY [Alphaproteobacteria bacterium]MDC0148295.1 rRNA maturation RNase YbeY [Alphaproteobacteria bacterium]